MLTPEQLESRRKGVTATDVAAILGLNPWKNALDVQLAKQGKAPPFEQSARMLAGQRLEPGMIEDYSSRHLRAVQQPGTIVHPDQDWARGTPDGVAYPLQSQDFAPANLPEDATSFPVTFDMAVEGVECKVVGARRARDWGEVGTDEVPPYVHVQCDWYMFLTGIPTWRVIAKIDLEDYEYVIRRDPELEDGMVAQAHEFWERHIVAGEPIPPDGSKSFTDHLASKFPKHSNDNLILASADDFSVISTLQSVRKNLATLTRADARWTQELKMIIGDCAGIEFDAITGNSATQRITWKRSRDGVKTDWEAIATAYRGVLLDGATNSNDAEIVRKLVDCIYAKNIKTTPGSRRFLVPRSFNE